MENIDFRYRMLGVVTLYNPKREQVMGNIQRYAPWLDALIVWDNSGESHEEWFAADKKVVYHWTGENVCIAPAINYAWDYAKANRYDLLLIMDQDSQWDAFELYRRKIENLYAEGRRCVFTPYVAGDDRWVITTPIAQRRVFINSGSVMPVEILTAIGGADEAFPLDALDHDMSYRVLKAGYEIICLTGCLLYHTVGQPRRSKRLHLFTNDYGRFRTYSMTRGHILNYRKHKDIMTCYEKRKFFKEIFMWKIIRLILAEDDKVGRFRMMLKGIKEGLAYKL